MNDFFQLIKLFNYLFSLFESVCFLIYTIALSGLMKIYKLLIWNKPIFFFQDFKNGIKENFKHDLLISFIVCLFYITSILIANSFGNFNILTIIFEGIKFAFIYPILIMFLVLSSIYSNTYIRNLKSSIQMYFKNFIHIILLAFILYAFLCFGYIKYISVTFEILIYIILILLILPLYLLLVWEIIISDTDKIINDKDFPKFYRCGLQNFNKEQK